MRRIAYCSPVNPQSSGISDYSEELLPYLGQYAEIVLFIPHGVEPSNPRLRQHLEIRTLDQLPRLHGTRPFDALVYHMGNSPVHAEIYERALELPGIIVLHDYVLHHFRLWYAAARRGDVDLYLREMRARYGERGTVAGGRMARGQLLDAAFEMPLVEELVERATGVIGHSKLIVERVRQLRPEIAATRVPMGVPLPPLLDRAAARAMLRLPADAPIWASFGHINPYKRIEPALRAFRHFRRLHPGAHYVLVGSVSASYDLQSLIRRLGLDDAVTVTGYVAPEVFSRYVAASDLCLNLRFPTAGETSASVLRLLGAGRPALVSAIDALDELPDGTCAKVDTGAAEVDQILSYALFFLRWPVLASNLGRSAREFVAREHSLAGAARAYIEFLAGINGWEAPAPLRPPLWELETGDEHLPPRDSGPGSPLAPVTEELGASGAARHLAQEAGVALAGLGITPGDEAILQDTAGTVTDLFDSPPAQSRPARRR
jgi:glycosyltransferase involved in cell wall biosynthesis